MLKLQIQPQRRAQTLFSGSLWWCIGSLQYQFSVLLSMEGHAALFFLMSAFPTLLPYPLVFSMYKNLSIIILKYPQSRTFQRFITFWLKKCQLMSVLNAWFSTSYVPSTSRTGCSKPCEWSCTQQTGRHRGSACGMMQWAFNKTAKWLLQSMTKYDHLVQGTGGPVTRRYRSQQQPGWKNNSLLYRDIKYCTLDRTWFMVHNISCVSLPSSATF